jgi:hypothetical protein
MSGYQVGLNSFGSEQADFPHQRDGYLDHLTWYNGRPALRFFGFDDPVNCDALIGEQIRITVHDDSVCSSCGDDVDPDRDVCWDCADSPPMTPCVWNPGTECSWRDCPYPEYKRDACAHTFVVYLVAKDTVKVGITRADRRQARWAEQGATHAAIIGECHNRKVAGIVEMCLAEEYPSKADSSWYVPVDDPVKTLVRAATEAGEFFPDRLAGCYTLNGLNPGEIRERVVSVPDRSTRVNDEIVAGTSELSKGNRQRGRVVGVRGSVIATESFTFNTKLHAGTRVTLETTGGLAVPEEDSNL